MRKSRRSRHDICSPCLVLFHQKVEGHYIWQRRKPRKGRETGGVGGVGGERNEREKRGWEQKQNPETAKSFSRKATQLLLAFHRRGWPSCHAFTALTTPSPVLQRTKLCLTRVDVSSRHLCEMHAYISTSSLSAAPSQTNLMNARSFIP